jgi:hypothetical protein
MSTIRRLDDTHTPWRVKVGGASREFDATSTEQNPDGFAENVAGKLGILDREVKDDMERFTAFIECRGGQETGSWRGDVDRPGRH